MSRLDVDDVPIYSHNELKRHFWSVAAFGYFVGFVFGAGITYVIFAAMGRVC